MNTDLLQGKGIRLYNLFPRLVGTMVRWKEHLPRIADMGFNAVFVNPFHYAGFSGSLYSPKDYFKFNQMFIDHSQASPNEQLRDFIHACHQKGMLFIMDLVINHTAIDCTLIQEHPSWYKRNAEGVVVHPGAWDNGRWTEWGDLAEMDNAGSSDRENLWQFWWRMMAHYMDLGVDGFRCDAAYQVPEDLWRFLIDRSRQKKFGCMFLAESLGCSTQMVERLARVGFDYLFNSSKYWDFNQPWGMEQYEKTKQLVASIAFPESHDTERLTQALNGNIPLIKRQIAFSTFFSKGLMIPIGLEFGFRRQMNVVNTDPTWWEQTGIDISGYIKALLEIKNNYPALNQEAGLEIVHQDNWYNVLCFKRTLWGNKPVLFIMNKDTFNHQRIVIPDMEKSFGHGMYKDISPESAPMSVSNYFEYLLSPSETKIIALI